MASLQAMFACLIVVFVRFDAGRCQKPMEGLGSNENLGPPLSQMKTTSILDGYLPRIPQSTTGSFGELTTEQPRRGFSRSQKTSGNLGAYFSWRSAGHHSEKGARSTPWGCAEQ